MKLTQAVAEQLIGFSYQADKEVIIEGCVSTNLSLSEEGLEVSQYGIEYVYPLDCDVDFQVFQLTRKQIF